MPASCGWHPGFSATWAGRGPRARLPRRDDVAQRTTGHPLRRGGVADTTAVGRFCFTDMVDPPELRWPGALTLEIESHCTDWVIFTEPDDALCVEPPDRPPDVLNLEPAEAAPGTDGGPTTP